MATNAQTLITAAVAAGYDRLSDRLLKEALLVAAQTGGGGSGNNDSQGTVDPVDPPTNSAQPAYYTNLTTGTIFTWNVTNQAWQ